MSTLQQIEDIVGCGFDKKDQLRFEIKFVNSWVDQIFLEKMIPEGSPLRLRMHMIKEEFLKKSRTKQNEEFKIKEEPIETCDQQQILQKETRDNTQHNMEFESEDTTLFMCNICYTTFPTHQIFMQHQEQCQSHINTTSTKSPQQMKTNNSKQKRVIEPESNDFTTDISKTQRNPLSSIVSKLRKAQAGNTDVGSESEPLLECEELNPPSSPKQSQVSTKLDNDIKPMLGTMVHECENCHMTFADAEYLQRHQTRCKNHADSAIKCNICGRGFTAKGSLELHIDAVHLKKKEFVCNICGKAFSRKHILKIHLDTHYGKKDFQCAVCGKRFLQKSNLNRHERIHESKNFGYGCRFCGQAFTQNKHLKNHTMALHPELIDKKVETV